MAKKPTITTIASGYYSRQALNSNFEDLRDAFDNTLSLDGSTPNAMQADLDLNGNNIIGADGLLINGTDYLADVTAAKTAALSAQAAAETAETNAETAEANAETSETNAATSATAAATSATASQTAQTAAELAETNAETAESNASTSATNAATSATNASTSASTASTKASEAATSATNAATSATNAETAKTDAETARDSALAALDSFDDRYLGVKTSDPTVDNDGDPLLVGSLYFNSNTDKLYIYDGAAWQITTSGAAAGDLVSTNNLSDLTSAPAARTNLGLGTAATTASTDYATAAQGALADTATQPADLATVATTGAYSDLTGKPTLGTAAATASTDYATAAQGTLADSAVQPNDSPTLGTITADGLTVDTDTLHVDATNNRVGIRESSPVSPFHVNGGGTNNVATFESEDATCNINFVDSTQTQNVFVGAKGDDFYVQAGGGEKIRILSNGNVGIGTNAPTSTLDVNGSLAKNSGSFKIDHPIKPDTHHLVHSFVEGPQADNLYRGKVNLVAGTADVNLDTAARMTEGTFVALNGNVQCFTSNEDGWSSLRGSVSGNILTIEAQDGTCTDTVSWLVIGERHDQHMLDTGWTDVDGRVITEPAKVITE